MPIRRAPALRGAAVAALLALAAPASADSLRCQGGIVSSGDSQVDLLGKCGQPALVEARKEQRGAIATSGDPAATSGERVTRTVETWTYDFGPNQFVQVVRLEDGKVVAVERGGYGFAEREQPARLSRARCDPAVIDEGERTFELLARCGEPAVRTHRREERLVPAGETSELSTRDVEVWIYDFGPNRLVRHVELVDGVVTRVDTGSHGYAERP